MSGGGTDAPAPRGRTAALPQGRQRREEPGGEHGRLSVRLGLLTLLSLNSNRTGGAAEWRSVAAGIADNVPLSLLHDFNIMVRGFRAATLSTWR